MSPTPTRASPAGCAIMLFGLASFAYTALCFRALYLLYLLPETEKTPTMSSHLWIHAIIAIIVGVTCLRYGWKSARAADMTNPNDPDKPKIRF